MSSNAKQLFYARWANFVKETRLQPTRCVMSWKLWRDLIESDIRHSCSFITFNDLSGDQKTMFDGVEIIRTYDGGDVMEFLK